MRFRTLLGTVLLASLAPCALAQAANSGKLTVGSYLANSITPIFNLMVEPTVKGKPYTAQRKVVTESKLADGTTITHSKPAHLVARDSEGRVRYERGAINKGGKSIVTNVYIKDPVANTLTMWVVLADSENSGANSDKPKVASFMKLPDLNKEPNADTGTPRSSSSKAVTTTEGLGQQSLEGLLVTGKRTTTTIPAGTDGNDAPIVITHEEWTSPDLQIIVKQIDSDPREGSTTQAINDISRENPPLSTFQPPAGYKLMDAQQQMKELMEKQRTAESAPTLE